MFLRLILLLLPFVFDALQVAIGGLRCSSGWDLLLSMQPERARRPHRKLGSLSGSQSDSERSILQNLARIGYFTAFTLDSSGY